MYGDESPRIDTTIFFTTLISGGLAGTIVDITLFPLDTLKTRLQSRQGFFHSGGFTKLYKGITPVILGSAPTAALFFVTYESVKIVIRQRVPPSYSFFVHMGAATIAESVSCLIRVPVESLKQRNQALISHIGRYSIRLLYRGYWSTFLRDVPFSLIQFPIWELFKDSYSSYTDRKILPIEGAICGSFAGSIAAAITTPLDVAKTRIMLANEIYSKSELKVSNVLLSVYRESGIKGLFSGILPRVSWIFVGGFIFFGVYEKSKALLM